MGLKGLVIISQTKISEAAQMLRLSAQQIDNDGTPSQAGMTPEETRDIAAMLDRLSQERRPFVDLKKEAMKLARELRKERARANGAERDLKAAWKYGTARKPRALSEATILSLQRKNEELVRAGDKFREWIELWDKVCDAADPDDSAELPEWEEVVKTALPDWDASHTVSAELWSAYMHADLVYKVRDFAAALRSMSEEK